MAVNATAVWRVRPGGSNTNGGGYDSAIAGAVTDYSQQNAPQLSLSDGALTHGTTTLTSATGGFTSAMVGNALYLSGTNFTTGWYFITGWTDTHTITIDRDPTASANGSAGTIHIGGGWADFWVNISGAGNPVVAGNTLFILGTGIPNPAAYVYDYDNATGGYDNQPIGSPTAGMVTFAGDPATPSFSSGGRPVIKADDFATGAVFYETQWVFIKDLYFVAAGSGTPPGVISPYRGAATTVTGCVLDQFGYDISLASATLGGPIRLHGCEVFSSVAKRSTNAQGGISVEPGSIVTNCNVHDCIGPGIVLHESAFFNHMGTFIIGNIAAKNGGAGILLSAASGYTEYQPGIVANNTVDGNLGNGIEFADQTQLAITSCFNNVISNHTQGGTYGLTVDAGAATANDLIKSMVDYNVFYNNTQDTNAISYGAHDTHGGSNPYVQQSTENYTLA